MCLFATSNDLRKEMLEPERAGNEKEAGEVDFPLFVDKISATISATKRKREEAGITCI